MADDNPYAGLVAQTTAEQARASVAQVADTNPDDEAFVQGLARQYGLPASTVKAQRKDVERRAAIDSTDYGQLAQASPATAGWITQQQNAAIGRDDTGALAGIENTLRDAFTKNYTGASLVSGLHTLAGTAALLAQKGVDMAAGGESNADTLSYLGASKDAAARAEAARITAGKPQGLGEDALYAMDFFGRVSRDEFKAAGSSLGQLSPSQQAVASRKYATTDPSQSAFLSPGKLAGDFLQNVPTFLALAATAKVAGSQGLKAEAEAVAAGADASAAAAARVQATAAALAKSGAISEGAIGYAQQSGQTEQQVAEEAPEVLAKSPAYQALLKAGFEPAVARIIIADRAATEAGTGAGVTDFVTNLAGGRVLGTIIGEGGGFIARALKGFATEGVQEAVQSPLEQVAQNAAVKAFADPDQKMGEGVAENALQGLAVGGLTGGMVAGMEGRAHARQGAAQEAVANAEAFSALDQLAAASKVRGRDPASFEQFVKSAAEDGPVPNVYVSGQALAETLAQAKVDPESLGPDLADQLMVARQTGGDVQIPVEQYATQIAGTDLGKALIPHLKTDPAGMSMTEAEAFMQSHGDELKAQVEKIVAANEGDASFKASAEAVKQNVLGQLNAAKRFTPDVNEAYAALVGNFYAVNAARLGITPEAMFERNPVNIAAEGVVSPEVLGQIPPAASDEAMQDYRDIDHADPDDPMHGVIRRALGDGLAVDDAPADARTAIQNGRPDVAAYILQKAEQGVTRDGVRPPWMADVIAKIKTAIHGELGGALDQGAPLEHGFHGWFGDSKVVDANGAPLVVYHGTNAEFSEFEHHDSGNDKGEGGWLGKGFYFHPDKSVAEAYGTKQMPVYLKLENPYDFAGQNFYKVVKEHGGPEAFSEWLRANGYDGAKGMSQFMVLDQTQIKSTTNDGTFDPNDPNIFRQDLPAPFYSALEKAALDTQTAKASPEQWAATLQKTPGVKKEELDWTGVLDWLESKKAAPGANAQASVTREELTAFLRNNGVQVEEIVHGGPEGVDAQLDEEEQQHIERGTFYPQDGYYVDEGEDDEGVKTYVVAGTPFDTEEDAQEYADELNGEEESNAIAEWRRDRERELESEGGGKWRDYKIEGADDSYRELLLTLPNIDGPGTHWNERNVVAHVRFTERSDASGKKVLFIEELQSDWHQGAAQAAKEAQRPFLNKAVSDITDFYDHASAMGRVSGDDVKPWSLEQKEATRNAAVLKWWKDVGSKIEGWANLSSAVAESVAAYDKAKTELTGYAMKASPEKIAEAEQAYERAQDAVAVAYKALAEKAAPALDAMVEEAQAKASAAEAEWREAEDKIDELNTERRAMNMRGEDPSTEWVAAYNEAHDARDQAYRRKGRAEDTARGYPNMRDKALGRSDYWASASAETKATALIEMIMHAKDRSELAHPLVDEAAGLRALKLRVAEAFQALENVSGSRGTPNAPFKNGYAALAIKRMIRWAVDNGHDQIAWINGNQQNGGSDTEDLGDWFYGRNLPNIVNDLVKKYGTKVEPLRVRLPGEERSPSDFTPEEVAELDRLQDESNNIAREVNSPTNPLRLAHSQAAEVYKTVNAGRALNLPGVEAEHVGNAADALRSATDAWSAELARTQAANMAYTAAVKAAKASPQLGFKITPELAKAAQEGFALFQNGAAPRGSYNPATQTITLMKAADLSTFLHESGHFFLETLVDIASGPHAPQDITDDMNAVLKWFGVDSLATWRGMSLNQQRESHEKFARAFEAYLFEGKAPSQQLVPLFQRFRAWMLNVYKQIAQLKVDLPDEIKGVFNRMLATNAQIAENERAHSYAPLFESAAQAGMTPQEWEDYQRLGMAATQEAVHELETRSLRDMRWLSGARDRTIRKLQREAAGRRKAVKAEVTAEVMAEPINRARTFLKRGVIGDDAIDGPTKLSLPDLKAAYGEAPTGIEEAAGQNKLAVDYRKLGYGKYGMLAEEGLSPDHVAELFGFSSGDELVKTLLHGEDPQAKINGLTDQRMMERYGDLHDPASIEKAADEAIHNDARLRFVGSEMNALAKATGGRRVLISAARDFANQMIAKLKVRDIRPSRYSSAEARAAINAEKALKGGKLVEAATEKRNQLINGYAAKAAYAAQDEIGKALRYLTKFSRDGVRKSIDPEYRDQIDQLLERFDLRSGQSLKAIDRRKSLANWIEGQKAQGFDPVVPDELVNEAFRKSYKDMTVEEMRGLIDSVRNIEHLGRLKTKLLTAKGDRDFAKARDLAEQTIRDNAFQEIKQKIETNGFADKVGSGVKEFFAVHRKFASLIRSMDGLKDRGALWELLVRPMNAAGDHEAIAREQATKALHAIFTPLFKQNTRTKLFIPEIGNSLSLEGRLAVALNWGNDTNRARIIDGDKWTADQVQAILKTLDPEHWTFVQQVWDHLDSYWPAIRDKELRVTGVAPERVEATPFTTPSGIDMRGGYYPIKYDPSRSSRAEADDLAEAIKSTLQGLYTRASTRRGHTKARVETVDRPVRKDFGVMFEHVSQVTHDLAWHEYLIDANRLLRSSQIDNAIRDHYGAEVLKTMRKSLEAMAAGDIPAQNVFERSVNYLRTGATMAALGYNLVTAAMQPIGLTQSIVRIGPKWVLKGAANWIGDAAHLENTVGWIDGKSEFMRLRSSNRLREISEIKNKVTAGKQGLLTPVQEGMFYLIGKLQLVADVPTWLGQYEKDMAGGADEASAIASADQAVRDSQGGGHIADLAEIQRGGPLMKLWTNFYSFFNVVYNQMAESVEQTRRVGASRLPTLAADVLLLTVIPSLLTTTIRKAMRGDDLDSYLADILKDQVSTWFGMMVGFRELGSIVNSDGNYKSPAGLSFLADAGQLYKQAEAGQPSVAALKAANTMGGVLFHYPSVQVQRTALGIQAMASGQTHNPLVLISGPPPAPHP